MEKVDIKSMDITELQELLQELGEPKFRAKQLFDWLHAKQVDSFAEMTNLSKSLREKLGETAAINGVKIVRRLVSQIDGTRKYLFALSDGAIIESVLMKYEHGNTVCISTQVGCRMGCKFCASTLDGVERGLTAGEMLSQIYAIQKDCGERVHGTVLMGSGEPLDNYDNVLKFLRWRRKIFRLHWRFPCMRRMTKSVCRLCLWQSCTIWTDFCRRAGITRRKQNAALPLNMR